MASQSEIMEALPEYTRLSNGNQRLRKMNRDWTKVVQLHATDLKQDFLDESECGRNC